MKIIIREGHLGGNEKIVPVLANNIQRSLDLMKKEEIKNLAINSQWGGGSIAKLDFLLDNPWVEGVMIVDNNVDIGSLNTLHHLKRLSLPDKYTGILDFRNFPELEILFCRWNKKQLRNIGEASSLQRASIFWINELDLSLLRGFRNLKRFNTCYSKIQSLHGIEHWTSLEKLELWKLPKLTNLAALISLADHIKQLTISGCKSFSDYSILKELNALEDLVLADGPPIQSVKFLEDMGIVSGFIGLEILDKKLDVLEQKGIRYWKYKSYRS